MAHLRPEQFVHRARLRTLRAVLAAKPEFFEQRWSTPTPASYGWPTSFRPLDAVSLPSAMTPDIIAQGSLAFVGEVHDVYGHGGWRPEDRSQLFRYNMHYFEWAWTLAAAGDQADAFGHLWRSWRAGTRFGAWDEWSPYVVSLRAWSLCGVFDTLVRGGPNRLNEAELVESLGLHARFLRANIEFDVGGNHLIKNLKALIGLGVFLGDRQQTDQALATLESQLGRQVLADGGHFERSPSYHAQVLGDLIDIASLLDAAGRPSAPLSQVVARMKQWLADLVLPDGDIALLGDSAPIGTQRLAALDLPPASASRLVVLAESGYVVARPTPGTMLIADVGAPCPPELPAHGQAGCLGFVLSVGGQRVVVDTGTSTYVGNRRAFERSTAAHSTVEIDGANQSEVWGSFRVGRRARPTLHDAADRGDRIVIDASHDGYRFLDGAPTHRRVWALSSDALTVSDTINGTGHHTCIARVVFAPTVRASRSVAVQSSTPGRFATASTDIAVEFGRTELTTMAEYIVTGALPLTIETELLFADVVASARLTPAVGEL